MGSLSPWLALLRSGLHWPILLRSGETSLVISAQWECMDSSMDTWEESPTMLSLGIFTNFLLTLFHCSCLDTHWKQKPFNDHQNKQKLYKLPSQTPLYEWKIWVPINKEVIHQDWSELEVRPTVPNSRAALTLQLGLFGLLGLGLMLESSISACHPRSWLPVCLALGFVLLSDSTAMSMKGNPLL